MPRLQQIVAFFQNQWKDNRFVNSQDIQDIVVQTTMSFINNLRPFEYFKGQEMQRILGLLSKWIARRILREKERQERHSYTAPESGVLSEDQPGFEGNMFAEGDTESELFGKDPTSREALHHIAMTDFSKSGNVFGDAIFNLIGVKQRSGFRDPSQTGMFVSTRSVPSRLIPTLADKSVEFLSSMAPQINAEGTLAPPPNCDPNAWQIALKKIFEVAMRGAERKAPKGGGMTAPGAQGEPGNFDEILRTVPGMESVDPKTFTKKRLLIVSLMKVALIKAKFDVYKSQFKGNNDRALKETLSDFTGLDNMVSIVCERKKVFVTLKGLITAIAKSKNGLQQFPSMQDYANAGVEVVYAKSQTTPTA